jgi:hypothetical protein
MVVQVVDHLEPKEMVVVLEDKEVALSGTVLVLVAVVQADIQEMVVLVQVHKVVLEMVLVAVVLVVEILTVNLLALKVLVEELESTDKVVVEHKVALVV